MFYVVQEIVNLNGCKYSKYELQLFLYHIYFMKVEHDTHVLSQTLSSVVLNMATDCIASSKCKKLM